ncbi:MAG: Gfo/Idh/MocA family oxidoreductase [Eubacterium sp.]|nr:Gfo/Idh/MocA family oxidoreductase [Eubacterium sp.]MBQ6363662.1 Gfo/Idh/MocA family oxidoreductase [Lachnospiraceae bacterium]
MSEQKMRVGVIGAGAISDIYLENMINKFDQLEVKCVAANHIESAQKKAEKYGIKACTTQELLDDPEIDLAVVLTPVGAHYGLIKQALLAGKHVYTEKTIADDVDKAKELVALAKEKGLYLGSAPDTFLGSALQTAAKAINDGLIGDIHSFVISANRNNDLLLSIFSFLRQPGAGIVCDYGVYYMTALVSLLGPVSKVGGIIGKPYPTHVNVFPMSPEFGQVMDTPNESQVAAVVQLENGITGTFHIDADCNARDEAYFAIYGTKGILYLTDANGFGGTVRFLPNALDPRVPTPPVELWSWTPYSENSRGVGPADLAEAAFEGRPCRASKEMAAHVLEALAGILKGGESGQFVDIESTCEKPAPLPVCQIGAKNIGHASFNMENVDEMIHFYCDVLGMKQQFHLTWGGLADLIRAKSGPEPDEETARMLQGLDAKKDDKWITYFKLADRQFMEVFHPAGGPRREIADRHKNYGYIKLNFEVESIEALRERLASFGVKLDDDIHPTIDGSREITVHDPDGNEVQFTEYAKGEAARIAMPPVPEGHSCSHVLYTTQVAYQVKDAVNMEYFYRFGLGLKKVFQLSYGELAAAIEQSGQADPKMIMGMKMMGDKAWIDYIEVAPHQYIELFHTDGQTLEEDRKLDDAKGYQHLCIEVEDIHAAWDAVIFNGLKPDEEIRLGPDGAYQFWLTDPDGNRLELMQYTEDALQLK